MSDNIEAVKPVTNWNAIGSLVFAAPPFPPSIAAILIVITRTAPNAIGIKIEATVPATISATPIKIPRATFHHVTPADIINTDGSCSKNIFCITVFIPSPIPINNDIMGCISLPPKSASTGSGTTIENDNSIPIIITIFFQILLFAKILISNPPKLTLFFCDFI